VHEAIRIDSRTFPAISCSKAVVGRGNEKDFIGKRSIWPVFRPIVEVATSAKPSDGALIGNPKVWRTIET